MWNEKGKKKQENEALIIALPKVNTCLKKSVRTPVFPASWGHNQNNVNTSEKNISP